MNDIGSQGGATGTGPALAESVVDRLTPPAYSLRVADDKLSVLLDCPDPLSDLAENAARILEDITKLMLPDRPSVEAVSELLSECCTLGEHLVAYPLRVGVAPVPPVDGRLEWSRDYFASGWVIDERTGAIDFWAKLENRGVEAGELLLKVYPPVPGEPGVNVYGAKIVVANPKKANLRCGNGASATTDENGITTVRADLTGRIRLNDATVSVDQVYVIKGDLDLRTGNVRHSGTLQIEGDVKQGVTIDVRGDIVVRGMVEPCDLTASGNLLVNGGIVGQEDGRISVGGSLQAKYVREAAIDAIGDVNVSNEIMHSRIRTLARVHIPNGRIAGGVTIARQGITLGQAGASGGTGTLLVAGADYLLETQVAQERKNLEDMERRRARLRKEIGTGTLPETTDSPQLEARNLGQMMADGETAIHRMCVDSDAACHAEIVILQQVWSGCTIQLGERQLRVRASIAKPRLARLSRSTVRLFPLGDGNMPDED